MMVSITPSGAVNLPIGSPLRLTCEVSGVGIWNRSALLVRWTRRGGGEGGAATAPEVEVARLGPDGVASWGDDSSRGGGGAVEMEAQGRYSLRLSSAHPADSGTYRCIVSVFAGRRDPGPSSPASVTQRSNGVAISFTTKGEGFAFPLHFDCSFTLSL